MTTWRQIPITSVTPTVVPLGNYTNGHWLSDGKWLVWWPLRDLPEKKVTARARLSS